jgi:hypothetical protein
VARIREENPRINKAQRSYDPTKARDVAPSARLTPTERARLPMISSELAKTRGASIKFGDIEMHFKALSNWAEFDKFGKARGVGIKMYERALSRKIYRRKAPTQRGDALSRLTGTASTADINVLSGESSDSVPKETHHVIRPSQTC